VNCRNQKITGAVRDEPSHRDCVVIVRRSWLHHRGKASKHCESNARRSRPRDFAHCTNSSVSTQLGGS
jgi:hypothetical protein